MDCARSALGTLLDVRSQTAQVRAATDIHDQQNLMVLAVQPVGAQEITASALLSSGLDDIKALTRSRAEGYAA